jgi:hypothetical protein
VNNAPARQVIRKVPPRRLAAIKTLNRDDWRVRLGSVLAKICSQLLKLQFQLIDKPLAALGARAEHLALHLCDHQLKVLDHRHSARQLRARLDQRYLQRILVVGKIRSRVHAQYCSTIALIRGIKSDA